MFKYFMPVKVFVGENCVADNSNSLILGTRAMIVTGKTSGKASGALDDVTTVLKKADIPYLVYDKIGNNPTIQETVKGGATAREFGADFLIGIGGGSPLDATKAIAVYAVNESKKDSDFDMYDIFKGSYQNKPLPTAAIPTTAGTGSEVTQYSILTLHNIANKKSFSSEDVFYKTAFLDGRYIQNLPLNIMRNTAIDAMCHLLEGFTNKRSNSGSDHIALEGLRIIGDNFDTLINGNPSVLTCTELLWASCLGGMVIAQTGTTIVHSMGYPLTYYKNVPHGLANGQLLGEYLTLTDLKMPYKTDLYLEALNLNSLDEFKEIIKKLTPCGVKFTVEELSEWTNTTIQSANVKTCPFDVTREMEIEIYKKCLL